MAVLNLVRASTSDLLMIIEGLSYLDKFKHGLTGHGLSLLYSRPGFHNSHMSSDPGVG